MVNDPNLSVKEEALLILSDLGNPNAVPLIIPLLGDLKIESGFRLSEYAAHTLKKLGAGEIVSAFYQVVNEGDMSAFEQLRPYRKQVIEALVRSLDSYLSGHIGNAARALKNWNAIEALSKLKVKLRWAWL